MLETVIVDSEVVAGGGRYTDDLEFVLNKDLLRREMSDRDLLDLTGKRRGAGCQAVASLSPLYPLINTCLD
jgi:hypothetical protein